MGTLHLIIEPHMRESMPKTVKITHEWGDLRVVIGDNIKNTRTGLHCFVKGPTEDLKTWLSNFDSVVVGNGTPMMEQFEILSCERS